MPTGKPTSAPTTGITKNPTTAHSPPITSVRVGTVAFSRRPGTAYLTTPPATSSRAAIAKVTQAPAEPFSPAQMPTPSATRIVPGSNGTTMPNSPTTTRRPQASTVPDMAKAWHTAQPGPGPPEDDGGPGPQRSG